MAVALIRDYLQTQGLVLPEGDVCIGMLAVRAAMAGGRAEIDRSILWYRSGDTALAGHLAPNPMREALLKQIFIALDSVYSRTAPAQSAAVYALMPSEQAPFLLRLVQQGQMSEPHFPVSEENGRRHLPVRTAQTGWLNLAADVAHWLENGVLEGGGNLRSQSQMSLPVCAESGAVLGVVHVEYAGKNVLTEAAQADWVALALALAAPMAALLQPEHQEEQNV